MKSIINFSLLFISTIFLFSCASMKATDFSLIKVGMSQEQVIKKIGKPNKAIGSKKYNDGVLEIYEYSTYRMTPDSLTNWLYFFNDELTEWGPKENYERIDYDRHYHKHRPRK